MNEIIIMQSNLKDLSLNIEMNKLVNLNKDEMVF